MRRPCCLFVSGVRQRLSRETPSAWDNPKLTSESCQPEAVKRNAAPTVHKRTSRGCVSDFFIIRSCGAGVCPGADAFAGATIISLTIQTRKKVPRRYSWLLTWSIQNTISGG